MSVNRRLYNQHVYAFRLKEKHLITGKETKRLSIQSSSSVPHSTIHTSAFL